MKQKELELYRQLKKRKNELEEKLLAKLEELQEVCIKEAVSVFTVNSLKQMCHFCLSNFLIDSTSSSPTSKSYSYFCGDIACTYAQFEDDSTASMQLC